MKNPTLFAAVAGLVFALAFSATPAVAGPIWTGLGDGSLWSDMANWQDSEGNWQGTDPSLGGIVSVAEDAATIDAVVDLDWTIWSTDRAYWNSAGTLTIPAGGVLCSGKFSRCPAAIYVTGGELRNDVRGNCQLLEVSAGSVIGIRWAGDVYGTLHIIGAGPADVHVSSWQRGNADEDGPPVWFTLDAGGVTPLRAGDICNIAAATPILQVDGIQDYLDAGGSIGDELPLIINTGANAPQWIIGDINSRLGLVHISETGVVLEIIPEPAAAALLLVGAPLLALRRRRA